MDQVLIGKLAHESNTFTAETTTRDHFRQRRECFDDAVFEELRGTNSAIGGAVDVAENESYTLYPTLSASARRGHHLSRTRWALVRRSRRQRDVWIATSIT